MGCAQLKRIDDLVKKKRLIFNWYYNQLIEIGNLSMNHERSDSINSYWMPTLVLDDYFKIDRDELIKRLDGLWDQFSSFFFILFHRFQCLNQLQKIKIHIKLEQKESICLAIMT